MKQCIAFKGIISWEVEDDNFTLKYGSMPKNVAMEKTFLIGFEKAIELKEAIEERVQIAVQRPETARQLQERALQLDVGDSIDVDVLAQGPKFGTGSFVSSEATPRRPAKLPSVCQHLRAERDREARGLETTDWPRHPCG